MKRFISLTMAAVLMGASVSACGFNSVEAKPESGNDKVEIVTTIFPEYDWVKNVLGENPADAEVTMLIDKGVDLHSFQPTADDIIKISSCDMFVYVGGESDEWVADALKEAVNKDMVVINLLDCLGDSVKEEEVVEGMQEEAHDHHHEEGEIEYDEHVWLSLRNAETLTQKISEGLQTIDHANAETYKKNAADYIGKLQALDADYQAAVDGASVRTLLFGDRFPFRYMVDDYGLDYFAAFVGCSAETEASFETVSFLSKKVDELSLPAVMTIEGPDHRIAETIVQNTGAKNQKILTLDSMQATTGEDVKNGTTYLSVMENNLSVLKEALD